MSEEESTDEVFRLIDRAHAEVARIREGGEWRMSIEMNDRVDSDRIIGNALRAAMR